MLEPLMVVVRKSRKNEQLQNMPTSKWRQPTARFFAEENRK